MDWSSKIKDVSTRNDFINFIEELSLDYSKNNEEWENKDLNSYFDAIASWSEDMENYYSNMKLDLPDNINWEFMAMLLYIGKIYE